MKPLFMFKFGKCNIRLSEWPTFVLYKKVNSILCNVQIKFGDNLIVVEDLTQQQADFIISEGSIYIEKEKERIKNAGYNKMPKL